MPNTKKFTVVIPTRNRAEFIFNNLTSLASQTRQFDDIIVVDDKSEDNTRAMVKTYFPNVIYLQLDIHSERQIARNLGVKAASTDWIVLLDSDDLLDVNYLLDVEKLLIDVPSLDAIYVNHSIFQDNSLVLRDKFSTIPAGFFNTPHTRNDSYIYSRPNSSPIASDLWFKNIQHPFLWPSGLAIRKSFYEEIGGFNANLQGIRSEDMEFTLRVIAKGNIGVIKKPLVNIVRHSGNSSISPLKQMLGEISVLKFVIETHDVRHGVGVKDFLNDQIFKRFEQFLQLNNEHDIFDQVRRLI